jgi:S1-C subfamily serine protease
MRLLQSVVCAVVLTVGDGLVAVVGAEDFAQLVEKARPSVVELSVTGLEPDGKHAGPFQGSGFVVHSDKALKRTYIVTAAHVVREDSEWLQDEKGRVKNRVIRVRREADNGTMELVADDALLIKADFLADAAVLSIPQLAIPPLAVGASTRLRKSDPVALLGFPAKESGLISRVMYVRKPDLPAMRIEFDDPADPGQSGGPIVDVSGRAVGIVSENTDRQNPKIHRSAIVSAALFMLNAHLSQLGRPQRNIDDVDGSTRISIATRTGQIRVEIAGTGGGKLSDGLKASQDIDPSREALVEAAGAEVSDCDQGAGRATSQARALGSVRQFETNGIMLTADLFARGGHYRSAAGCLAGKPVGLKGHDTTARASVSGTSEIALQSSVAPFDLRVAWRDMPKGSIIEILDPNSSVRSNIQVAEGEDERTYKADVVGTWRVRCSIDASIEAAGSTASVNLARQPILFVDAR